MSRLEKVLLDGAEAPAEAGEHLWAIWGSREPSRYTNRRQVDGMVQDFASMVQFREKGKQVEGVGERVAQLMDHEIKVDPKEVKMGGSSRIRRLEITVDWRLMEVEEQV